MITDPRQADAVVSEHGADFVLLARKCLRQPYFRVECRAATGLKPMTPVQYGRAII